MKKIIYLFRHGQTDWNQEGRMQGHTDIPLNATGRAQAQKMRSFFEKHPVDAILSSDLRRAMETAEIAVGHLGVPMIVEPLLRETRLGEIEGLTLDTVLAKYGDESWEKWRSLDKEHADFRFPGGESRTEHTVRLFKGLENFLLQTQFKTIAASSHGGSIRRIVHYLRPDLKEPALIANCTVYELDFDTETRQWTVELTPRHID